MSQKSDAVNEAIRLIIEDRIELPRAFELSRRLKKERAFGYAGRILALARRGLDKKHPNYLELTQQHALCTYKNIDLPNDTKYDEALQILSENGEDLTQTSSQETLGIAGAIYKYKWNTSGQKVDLERSLAYYKRGYDKGVEHDQGYTAINTAFVLDVLANIEEEEASHTGFTSETAVIKRNLAKEIRKEIVAALPDLPKTKGKEWLKDMWWFWATIAEAHFGLQQYDKALENLGKAKELEEVQDWEIESTTRQLASLTRLIEGKESTYGAKKEETEAWKVLTVFLGKDTPVESAFMGKIGLALSGGGFRASLFHIGVLAKLAEYDILRHVEVISCVSGGSILGTHYYLELRNLLQTKRDDEITPQHYIEIVEKIEKDFLSAIQTNIRSHVLLNVSAVIRMISDPHYSRTNRLGELYEKKIFSKIKDGLGHKERFINDLIVEPLGAKSGFSPKDDNWRRRAKVPILILNATSLNTGHNFQFTATWMGEPPAGLDSEVDANYRLRRMYYDEAPEKYRRYRLGYAVAASSCVPGLFEPITLDGLYPDILVRLVDGGVNDNQGGSGLLDQNCNITLISDASGQMNAKNIPGKHIVSGLLRSNSILQARVRSALYQELENRRRSSLLQGLLFLHLKKDLEAQPIDWIGCEPPSEEKKRSVLTSYHINKEYQSCLANIRTDLDSFSDVEAFALMTSGYLMTETMLPKHIKEFSHKKVSRGNWRFLTLANELGSNNIDGKLLGQLRAASSHTF
ncbi:MAG: patatin-like phospholipase family protein [Nitrospirae bacterium]|nr:patatin-like phospholipase family protein [Nitrospirota bacterium]